MNYNSKSISEILNRRKRLVVQSLPIDKVKQSMLKNEKYYTPDFQVGVTPSIESCVEVAVRELSKDNYTLNAEIHGKEIEWHHKLGERSYKGVLDEMINFMNSSPKSIEDLMKAKSQIIRKLKKKQGSFFKQLVDVIINFFERESYLHFLIESSPCFFEPSDIDKRIDYFFQERNYSFQERFREKSTKFVDLRKISDNGRKIQNVSMKLFIGEDSKIRVKYVVHNLDDKLDVVVGLGDSKIELMHYDVKRFTPREGVTKNTEYEFKQSTSTGDYILKSKIDGEERRLFFEESKMKKERLFKTLADNPILLGGNAFVYIINSLRENIDKIKVHNKESNSHKIEYTQ